MLIYPAIDLLDGRCVRLQQGSFERSTVYSDDPHATMRGFAQAGATHLHLVDLSGAKNPAARQTAVLAGLLAETSLHVQVGGGVRTFAQARELLELGADRVVIGSAAVSDPALVLELLEKFGGARVTVALDVRVDAAGLPCVALHGWQAQSALGVGQVLRPFLTAGLARVLCTDISRDGMMAGPNEALYQSLARSFPSLEFQASGGVSSLQDLQSLQKAGILSAIVGKAIYEGAIDLGEAIRQC